MRFSPFLHFLWNARTAQPCRFGLRYKVMLTMWRDWLKNWGSVIRQRTPCWKEWDGRSQDSKLWLCKTLIQRDSDFEIFGVQITEVVLSKLQRATVKTKGYKRQPWATYCTGPKLSSRQQLAPWPCRAASGLKTLSKHFTFKRSSNHNADMRADRSFARMFALAKSELKTPPALAQGLSQVGAGHKDSQKSNLIKRNMKKLSRTGNKNQGLNNRDVSGLSRCLTQIFCFQIFRRLSHLKLKLCIPLQHSTHSTHKALHKA